jgi:hypothetical protein
VSNQEAPAIPCSVGYAPVMIDVVAAGVIEGKMVVDSWCISPASARRFKFGS